MEKKRLLVTGSCGFIFSNFIRKIIYEKSDEYSLISLDKVSFNPINSLYWNKNHSFHIADIRDQHIIDKIFEFEKPDFVIHGAASTHVDNSLTAPNEFITNNVLGTQVVINSCVKYGVSKLVIISTDEVYGALCSETDESWTEECVLNPRNPYSASKAATEMLLKAAHNAHGLNYNIIRPSNNYGPRQTPDKLIPKVIKCVSSNQKIPIYGKGAQIRSWMHVLDNCAGIITVLEKGSLNEAYNIDSNQEFTNIEIVQKICNVMNKGHELISFIEDPRKKAHDYRYSLNCDKIKKLGWKSEIKFKDGIEQCVEWYLKNSNWIFKD